MPKQPAPLPRPASSTRKSPGPLDSILTEEAARLESQEADAPAESSRQDLAAQVRDLKDATDALRRRSS